MGKYRPSAEQRRIGLQAIAEIRDRLSRSPKTPKPFRHDHDGPDPCPVCGRDPLPAGVARLRRPA